MIDLASIPCWYVILTAAVTGFHVVRGAVGQTYLNPAVKSLTKFWQKLILFYIHDFLLHLVCTVFGFFFLYVAFTLAQTGLQQLSASATLLLAFLTLVGLAGVTGQLAVLLLSGKLPWLKE